jgi:hypothetical protein
MTCLKYKRYNSNLKVFMKTDLKLKLEKDIPELYRGGSDNPETRRLFEILIWSHWPNSYVTFL